MYVTEIGLSVPTVMGRSIEILGTSWCQGNYREELRTINGVKQTFCAVGAVSESILELDPEVEAWSTAVDRAGQHPIMSHLAEVIMNKYADHPALDGLRRGAGYDEEIVITFNDDIAEHADEVIEVFKEAQKRLNV